MTFCLVDCFTVTAEIIIPVISSSWLHVIDNGITSTLSLTIAVDGFFIIHTVIVSQQHTKKPL